MSEGKQKLLLIDSNYLCHYCAYSSRTFSHNGNPTGVIFSFLRQVLGIAKRFTSRRFAFAWDSRKSIRRVSYQAYKQNRNDRQKSLEERELETLERGQFEGLRKKVLPELGFRNLFFQIGFEADDLIASIVLNERKREEIVIVGADNDLYQLLDSKVSMYKPREKTLYTVKDFKEEWGIIPNQWPSVKSIAGCSGDNVQGVPGVGERTAIQYLLGQLRGDSKKAVAIRNSGDMIDRNASLVTLPLVGTKKFELVKNEVFYLNDFFDVVGQYGLNSFRSDETVKAWRESFEMRSR